MLPGRRAPPMMPPRLVEARFEEDDDMMLQAMKGKFGSFILKIFAVLLIISFGAWGIGDMITGQGLPTDVADVGETKISANQFPIFNYKTQKTQKTSS